MTQEEQQLLLIELCARLPYGTRAVDTGEDEEPGPFILRSYDYKNYFFDESGYDHKIKNIKPYLRPISSMAEEECDKLFEILKIKTDGSEPAEWIKINDIGIIRFYTEKGIDADDLIKIFDYLNSIHIDYRGLIPMGLALPAKEGMYN